jgi:hypothetical protein
MSATFGDAATLARSARTVVSGAGSGVLQLVRSVCPPGQRAEGIACTVIDHDGEPIIALPTAGRGFPLAASNRRAPSARLTLRGSANEDVSLTGRLVGVDADPRRAGLSRWAVTLLQACDREGAVLLRFSVDSVCIVADGVGRRVDLFDYALAEPDVIAAHGPRIGAHLNHAHPSPIRVAAAGSLGLAPERIIGAEIVGLDPDGVDLTAVDGTGAHCVRLRFSQRVSSVDELASALRGVLAPIAGRSPTRHPNR